MRLRILSNQRLNALLLVAREIEMRESPHPVMLELCLARHAVVGLRWSGILTLLSACAQRHSKRYG